MKNECILQNYKQPELYTDKIKMLVCITMYEESFAQFLQTVAGVLNAIAELEQIDPFGFKGRIGIVCVADGSDKIKEDFILKADYCNLICKTTLDEKSKD